MPKILVDALPLGPLGANCYIVRREGDTACLVIDPGDDVKTLKCTLSEKGLTPAVVFLTHAHFDHMLGAAYLKKDFGAKIAVSEKDSACLYDKSVNLAPTGCNTRFLETHADEIVFPGAWEAVGIPFTVIAAPGHTEGGLCLVNEENKLLFSGDTLFNGGFGRTDLPGGSWQELLISLRKLLSLPEDLLVYSGHGDSATIGEIRKVLMK